MKTTKTHTLPNIPHPLTLNISLVFLKSEEVKDSTGSGWLYHLHFVSLLTLTLSCLQQPFKLVSSHCFRSTFHVFYLVFKANLDLFLIIAEQRY